MRIELEHRSDLCILRLNGRFLTGSNAEYQRVRDWLEGAVCRNLVVDCSALPYLDSTGLAFLVGIYSLTSRSGGRVALANVSPRIQEVLRITKLDGIIPAFEGEEDALAAVRSPATYGGARSAIRHRSEWL
jgi:anti-anti-sigma factor